MTWNWTELIGYLAVPCTIATFSMKTMIPLRIVALTSNIVFIVLGLLGQQYAQQFHASERGRIAKHFTHLVERMAMRQQNAFHLADVPYLWQRGVREALPRSPVVPKPEAG